MLSEERRAKQREYYRAHKDIWRIAYAKQKASPGYTEYRRKQKVRINALLRQYKRLAFEKLGGVCTRCGFSDWRALQVDHINGGGCAEHKRAIRNKNGYTFYRKVFESPDGVYQLLCANCNWIKAYENKERPGAEFPVTPDVVDVVN